MNLDKDLGFLKGHAALVSAGITTEQALSVVTGEPTHNAEYYRTELRKMAMEVDNTIINTLNSLTTDQITAVISDHKHIPFTNPYGGKQMFLQGITMGRLGNWYLVFDNGKECRLHELDIQEVLGLMATCDNCLAD